MATASTEWRKALLGERSSGTAFQGLAHQLDRGVSGLETTLQLFVDQPKKGAELAARGVDLSAVTQAGRIEQLFDAGVREVGVEQLLQFALSLEGERCCAALR